MAEILGKMAGVDLGGLAGTGWSISITIFPLVMTIIFLIGSILATVIGYNSQKKAAGGKPFKYKMGTWAVINWSIFGFFLVVFIVAIIVGQVLKKPVGQLAGVALNLI